jgi:N-methylhydantoinase A
MAAALRVVTVNRGVDPRSYALMAFGGAGPLHAADIADELGIDRILVPSASGVLAALGLVVAPQRRDVQRSVFLSGDSLRPDRVAEHVEALADRARQALGGEPETVRVIHELRYAGQSFELPIEAAPERLREAFEVEHERRYGYREPQQPLELVTIRVSAFGPTPQVHLPRQTELPEQLNGPMVVRLPESTLVVPHGWRGHTDETGTIHLERWTRSSSS